METTLIAKKMLSQMESGWNNADAVEFVKPFGSPCEFVDIRGTLHSNATPQQLARAHQGLWMSIYKDSKVKYHLVQVVDLNKDTSLVNVQAALDAPSGPLTGKSSSTISMLLTKAGDEWKIRAFHNTLISKH